MTMRYFFHLVFFCAGVLSMSSCSYRFGNGSLSERYTTMSVPYIKGDKSGEITAELIGQLSRSGTFAYKDTGGELSLKVKILKYHDQNIGFQYSRDENGDLLEKLVPTESRLAELAEVWVEEAVSGKVILEPRRVSASVDYDFDPDLLQETITTFSLGQFNAVDSARDVVARPLNKALAEQIIDYVTSTW